MQKQSLTTNMTIITCAMKFHEPFLVSNYFNLRKFSKEVLWIIINNDDAKLDLPDLIEQDQKIVIQKGPPLDTTYGAIAIGVHHAKSLEIASRQVKTRYTLILDPDFVVINWNLIMRELSKINQNKVVAIGTPWFPTWYRKKVNSLAPHFVLIKSAIIQNQFEWYPIDLVPEKLKIKDTFQARPRSDWPIFRYPIFKQILLYFFNRTKINTEYDTFGSTEILAKQNKVTFLLPQLTRNQLAKLSPILKFKIGRMIEKIIPPKYRYLLRPFTIAPFELDFSSQHIEHWVVGNEIFGVHMRSFGAGKLLSKDLGAIEEFGRHLNFLTNGKMTTENLAPKEWRYK
jgi:hypothetical protein